MLVSPAGARLLVTRGRGNIPTPMSERVEVRERDSQVMLLKTIIEQNVVHVLRVDSRGSDR